MLSRALLLFAILTLPGATIASPDPGPAVLEAAAIDTKRPTVDRARQVYILPEPAALALTGLGLTFVVWRVRRGRVRAR